MRQVEKYDEAIACCSLALEANPKFHEAYLEKGHALYELGRFKEAVDAYERGLKVPGQFTFRVVCDLFFAKGVTLDRLGNYDEAIVSYDSALRISPKDDQIYALKVNALHKLGRYDDIIVTFGELFKRKPDFTGKIDHMDIYYDKLLESNPNDINILYKKGQFLYESKKYREAVVTFDRVLAINPNHYGAQTDKKNALAKA